ncbi:MAG: hypothetical protein JRN52_13415 [Nitrososphaerota archaeon]|nr:hypothetical protein [Nitrososphaerota archaeon]
MNEREILEQLLETHFKNYLAITKKLGMYEPDDPKYASLLNSQMKVTRSIQNCISLLRDPKKQILPRKKERSELATMMEAVKTGLMYYKGEPPEKTRNMTVKDLG